MTDDELIALVNAKASESGMGGMEVGTIYGDLALEVAKAVRDAVRDDCEMDAAAALRFELLGR